MTTTTGVPERNPDTHPLDSDIKRNRIGRFICLLVYIALSIVTAFTLDSILTDIFFNNEIAQNIFSTLLIGGVITYSIAKIEKLFIIRNSSTGMLVTIDQLRSLLGMDNVNVSYGPGTSLGYPWEIRTESNNLSLEEAANEFESEIQCADGSLMLKGSYRMRPNFRKPVAFLTGVAAVASDIEGLLKADILSMLCDKTVVEALRFFDDKFGLNAQLSHKYNTSSSDSDVEERYGVSITDVTISQLLPSEDVRKTMSAVTEAESINRGTEIILGMSRRTINSRIKEGTLTMADVNLARDRFLSISGNLEGMQINRSEFDVSIHGLDTEAVKAIADIAKTPGAQAAIAAGTRKKGSQSKKGDK